MPSLRLTVQSFTPLLMYGADQNQPELRGSSFRGSLRYWLRAVLGAECKTTNELYEKESAYLGSTEKGSRIKIRIQPKRTGKEGGLYVMPERTSKGYSPRFNGYLPDSEFLITLSTHPLDNGDLSETHSPPGNGGLFTAQSPLVKAVFLMCHFGGVGRRARRGSGNLYVAVAKGYEDEPPLDVLPDDRQEMRTYLSEVSKFIGTSLASSRPRSTTFAENSVVVLLGQETHTRCVVPK